MPRKTTQTSSLLLNRLAAAYEKVLTGVPLNKIKLSKHDEEKLENYLKFAMPGKSAYQVADASQGIISSALCAELAKVRKRYRRKILEENLYSYEDKKIDKRKIACK